MAEPLDATNLPGKQFTCQVKVIAVGPVPSGKTEADRLVTMWQNGDQAQMALGEFLAVVAQGFLEEVKA